MLWHSALLGTRGNSEEAVQGRADRRVVNWNRSCCFACWRYEQELSTMAFTYLIKKPVSVILKKLLILCIALATWANCSHACASSNLYSPAVIVVTSSIIW